MADMKDASPRPWSTNDAAHLHSDAQAMARAALRLARGES
jgi:hypothetical protein